MRTILFQFGDLLYMEEFWIMALVTLSWFFVATLSQNHSCGFFSDFQRSYLSISEGMLVKEQKHNNNTQTKARLSLFCLLL